MTMISLATDSIGVNGIEFEQAYGLILMNYGVTTPNYKSNYVEIPGKNGVLDLTEALGLYFENREVVINEAMELGCVDFVNNYTHVVNAWHGQRVKVILDCEQDYYYRGRCSIEPVYIHNELHGFTMTIDAEPFKYPLHTSGEDWLWDPFEFSAEAIRSYKDILINGTREIAVIGYERAESPVIICSNNMTLLVDDEDTYNLIAGTNTFPELMIASGTIYDAHSFKFTGNGTVTIEMKGGVI